MPADGAHGSPAPVVFDLDGVLVHTEHLWEESWAAHCAEHGVEWTRADTLRVQGMSSPEWSRDVAGAVHERSGIRVAPAQVLRSCVGHMRAVLLDGRGPLLPGARELVTGTAALTSIGLASSAARAVIDTVLAREGLAELFATTVSSEEVARGKPSPDVYTEALRRLAPPCDGPCPLAVEDSGNGLRAAHAAGLRVVALPNPDYPPGDEALALAEYVASDHAEAAAHLRRALTPDGAPPDDT
ncbi:HAD family hydrolase [Nocardiopsis salina]|uniref:HAD family hydrolase n=1 Tax=Nocardiopsis salina TaxID=245836 RepID=UPI00034DFC3E|nr:HAD family phosphatase [Nocardiopsis salina]